MLDISDLKPIQNSKIDYPLSRITDPIEEVLSKPAGVYRLWSGSGGFSKLRMDSKDWPLKINPYILENHFQKEFDLTHYYSIPVSTEISPDGKSAKQIRLGLFHTNEFSAVSSFPVEFFSLNIELGPKFESLHHNDYKFDAKILYSNSQLEKNPFFKKADLNGLESNFVAGFIESLNEYSKSHW